MQNQPRQIHLLQKISLDILQLWYVQRLLHHELTQSFHVSSQQFADLRVCFQSAQILTDVGNIWAKTHLCIKTIIPFPCIICITIKSWFFVECNNGPIMLNETR